MTVVEVYREHEGRLLVILLEHGHKRLRALLWRRLEYENGHQHHGSGRRQGRTPLPTPKALVQGNHVGLIVAVSTNTRLARLKGIDVLCNPLIQLRVWRDRRYFIRQSRQALLPGSDHFVEIRFALPTHGHSGPLPGIQCAQDELCCEHVQIVAVGHGVRHPFSCFSARCSQVLTVLTG